MGNEVILKRVSKHNINKSHELFNFCDQEAFKSKNMKNLANYHIRQCFILGKRESSELSESQVQYIDDMNKAIKLFNKKSKELFDKKKSEKILKAKQSIEDFKKGSSDKESKEYLTKLDKLEKSLDKIKESEYKPHKPIGEGNGFISYDFLNYYFADYLKSEDNPYRQLATQTAQQIMRTLFKDWKSFFKSIESYNKDKSKFTGPPKMPKYKAKNGRHKLSYTNQSCKIVDRRVIFPKTNLTLKVGIPTEDLKLKEVRVVPLGSIYKIELVWDKTVNLLEDLNKDSYIGIDLGLKNLATITNNIGKKPIIINGKPLVSINQYYNKKKAKMQKLMPFTTIAKYDKSKGIYINTKIQKSYSKSMDTLTRKRNSKIEDYMHKTSRFIIEYCIDNKIGNIVIGKNDQWKTELNLGRQNNQNFISIPFDKLIDMVKYKAEAVGISVFVVEESYSSKSSFLDLDNLPTYKKGVTHKFTGKRITRGLYKTGKTIINADVNGSYNILRKHKKDMFTKENIAELYTIPKVYNINGHTKSLKQKMKSA